MMTRRDFMGTLAIVTAAGGFGLGGTLVERRRFDLARIDAARIDVATVRSLERRDVLLRGAGRAIRANVQDVRSVMRRGAHGAPDTEQISICLTVDDRDAPAGAYRLEDDRFRLDELYFTSINGTGSDRRLEAVITRIV